MSTEDRILWSAVIGAICAVPSAFGIGAILDIIMLSGLGAIIFPVLWGTYSLIGWFIIRLCYKDE